METLSKVDLHHILTRLPKDVVQLLRDDPRVCIGGGIIRAVIAQETPNDIDIFGQSKEIQEATAKKLAEGRIARGEPTKTHKTDNAITVLTAGRLPVQFITRWTFDDAKEVMQSFDFTVCQAVIFYDPVGMSFDSHTGEDFYQDLAARRLNYTAPCRNEDAGGSLLRVIKYIRRGYSIQVKSLGAVCARLYSGIEPGSSAITDEAERAVVLAGLLREVDPLLMIDGVEISEEDEHNPERVK